MSVLRAREKVGWFVCITLLIILSCRGVQSQKDEEEPEPEPASNIRKQNIECDFSDPMICGYKVRRRGVNRWRRVKTNSGYDMSYIATYGTSELISPYKNLTDSCVQIDYRIYGMRMCSLNIITDHDRKLKLRLKPNSAGRAQFYVKKADTAIRFQAGAAYRGIWLPVFCHIRIEKVSIHSGTCPALETVIVPWRVGINTDFKK